MSVYFIAAPEVGTVKIGFAGDPWSRFSKIQTDSPTRVVLLAVIEGSTATEAEMHLRFADQRVRGEWFRHEGALAEYIGTLTPFAKPTRESIAKHIAATAGISQAYASMIMAGARAASVSLAIHVFRASGWRHPRLAEMTEDEMRVFEKYDPWSSQMARQA